MRRVVVTGVGIVSPLGCGEGHEVWRRIISGASGVQRLSPEVVPAGCGVTVAGRVPRGTNELEFDESEYKVMDREVSLFIKFALKASQFALTNSKLDSSNPYAVARCGVSIGNGGIGSLGEIVAAHDTLKQSLRKISPYFVPKILVNMAAGHVSIRHGFQGPVHNVATACAAGTHSIGDAANFIKLGYADLMLAGGTDCSIEPLALAGFSRMKALSTPTSAIQDETMSSRPFDATRNGFVMGEGAAVLVLEELEAAVRRGAPIIAEVCGYGLSGDAHHATTPPEDGAGAYRAMTSALRQAQLSASDISYVNAHATSTPLGDLAELQAIRRIVQDSSATSASHPLWVSSCKGALGHLLGAAGAVETGLTALSLQHGKFPHTLNLETPDPAIVKMAEGDGSAQRRAVTLIQKKPLHLPEAKYALKNSFGFGGTNASLILGKYS